jgi:hypothetical protein
MSFQQNGAAGKTCTLRFSPAEICAAMDENQGKGNQKKPPLTFPCEVAPNFSR